jgi:hypothetical protein
MNLKFGLKGKVTPNFSGEIRMYFFWSQKSSWVKVIDLHANYLTSLAVK